MKTKRFMVISAAFLFVGALSLLSLWGRSGDDPQKKCDKAKQEQCCKQAAACADSAKMAACCKKTADGKAPACCQKTADGKTPACCRKACKDEAACTHTGKKCDATCSHHTADADKAQ